MRRRADIQEAEVHITRLRVTSQHLSARVQAARAHLSWLEPHYSSFSPKCFSSLQQLALETTISVSAPDTLEVILNSFVTFQAGSVALLALFLLPRVSLPRTSPAHLLWGPINRA